MRMETTREKVQLFRTGTYRSNVAYRMVRRIVGLEYRFEICWVEAPPVLAII